MSKKTYGTVDLFNFAGTIAYRTIWADEKHMFNMKRFEESMSEK